MGCGLCGGAAMEKPRQVVRKFLARPQHEGVGAVVRRSIGRYVGFISFIFRIQMPLGRLHAVEKPKEPAFLGLVFCFADCLIGDGSEFGPRRFELRYFDPFLVLDEFSGEPPSIRPLISLSQRSIFINFGCPCPNSLQFLLRPGSPTTRTEASRPSPTCLRYGRLNSTIL